MLCIFQDENKFNNTKNEVGMRQPRNDFGLSKNEVGMRQPRNDFGLSKDEVGMRQLRNYFRLSKEMNEKLGGEGGKMPLIAATMLFSKFTKLSSSCTELSTL